MSWDKTNPGGSTSFAQSDDEIRNNNDAIETAVDAEHRFATGGNQSGRHEFEADTTTNLGGVSDVPDDGWLGWSTDERSGRHTLMTTRSGSVEPADVEPVDGSSNPTLPRVNDRSKFTVCQFAEWEEVTPGAGTPNTLAVDLTGSPLKYATITADTEIQTPTGSISGHGTVVTLDLVMSGGAWDITFTSNYKAVGGTIVVGGASTRTRLTLQVMQTGGILVSSTPDWNNTIS